MEQPTHRLPEYPPTGDTPTRREQVPWTALDMVLALMFGALVGVFLLVLILATLPALGIRLPRGAGFVVLSLALYGPLSVGVWLFALQRHRATWRTLGFRRVPIGAIFAMIPVLFVVMIANVVVTALISLLLGNFRNPQEDAIAPGGVLGFSDFVWLFVAVAVLAPIIEELTFRGMLYHYLRNRMGIRAAVLLSSGVFAVVHVIPILIPVLFVVGIALALVTERYKSILPAIALHALNNGTSLTLLYIGLNSGA